ncbi:MAG: LytR C-terminal domain-containing protein [Patescibacteria group bacterium]
MTETVFPYQNQQKKEKKTTAVIVAVVFVLVAAIIAGVLWARRPQNTAQVDTSPTVAVQETEPTPTEKPQIEKSSVTIQVLNGTGTPGQAGIVVDALEEAGYDTDNIKSGNADEYDYTETTISARSGFDEIVDDIRDTLEPTFENITFDSSELDDESEFDIVIVTGGEIYEAPTSAPSSSSTSSNSSSSPPSPTTSPTPTP